MCMCCKALFESAEDFSKHPCNPIFKLDEDGGIAPEVRKYFKPSKWSLRWAKFYLYIGPILAMGGLIVVNTILLRHLHVGLWEGVVEGLGFGFAVPYLLNINLKME